MLAEKGISLVALGFERVGVEDFAAAKCWDGDALFVDSLSAKNEGVYALLGTKRGALYQLLRPSVFKASAQARKDPSLGGDVSTGDGLQLGGVYIFDKKGNIIFEHVQKDFTDDPAPEDVIQVALKAIMDDPKE